MNKKAADPADSLSIFEHIKVLSPRRVFDEEKGAWIVTHENVMKEVRRMCPFIPGVNVGSEQCYTCAHQRRRHWDGRYRPWTVACAKMGELFAGANPDVSKC